MERQGFVGIDVSSGWLDVAFRPGTELVRVNNEPRAITRLVRMLERRQPELVVLEASGGYEMAVLERLLAKEIPVALLNPRQVRQFARASGRMAKTDAIDAEVLAHFAEVMKPQPRRWADLETRQLRALVNRRHQLVQMVTAEQNRRRLALAVVRDGFGATLRCLKLQITANCGVGRSRAVQSRQRTVQRQTRHLGRPRRCAYRALHEHPGGGSPQSLTARFLPPSAWGRENYKDGVDRLHAQVDRYSECHGQARNALALSAEHFKQGLSLCYATMNRCENPGTFPRRPSERDVSCARNLCSFCFFSC